MTDPVEDDAAGAGAQQHGPRPVEQWQEIPELPAAGGRKITPFLGPLVGFAFAVLLAVSGRRTAALVLVAVVSVVFLLLLVVPFFGPALARIVHGIGHVAGRALSFALLGVVELVVIIPIWMISRVFRWNSLRPGAAPPGDWQEHVRHAWQALPVSSFSREARLSGRRRVHALAIFSVLVLLVFAVSERDRLSNLVDQSPSPPVVDTTSGSTPQGDDQWDLVGQPPSHGGPPLTAEPASWAREMVDDPEHDYRQGYDATLIVRPLDVSGPYLNVHDRVRKSYVPEGMDPDAALDVWFIGSSALFGPTIIRDDHTIPSEIVRLGWEDGVAIRASNMATPGYRTWQEAVLLAQLLTERPDPDLVVVYGGYNELSSHAFAGSPSQVSSYYADEVRQALADAGASSIETDVDAIPRTPVNSPENAALVYDRSMELIDDLTTARGIALANFIQPSLWSRHRPEDATTLANIGADQAWADSFGALLAASVHGVTSGAVDLSDVLSTTPGVLYYDEVHHNELANRVIAEAMYQHLEPQLHDLAGNS